MNNTIMCEWCGELPAILVHRVERQVQRQMEVTLLDGTIILDGREDEEREWDEACLCRECAPAFFGRHYTDEALDHLLDRTDSWLTAHQPGAEVVAQNAWKSSVTDRAESEDKAEIYDGR
jgi:hypothetical protein